MDWHTKASEMYSKGMEPKEISLALGVNHNTLRRYLSETKQCRSRLVAVPDKQINLTESVLKMLSKEGSISAICDHFGIGESVFNAIIEELTDKGYMFFQDGDVIKLSKTAPVEENTFNMDWNGDKIIRFGVAGDKQMGSKWQQLTHLNTMYDIFRHEGIKDVFDPGDLTDGCRMRPGHEYEIFIHGADEQENYVGKKHPRREGITTHFILGNHDAAHIKNGGRNIGPGIAYKRNDMKYLGMYNARVNITPNCVIELNHPWDGAAYALSYSPQKYIDSMTGGEKPNILLNGHHHKALYFFYRNIHAFETGTFCGQTPFMKGKRIAAHVGGWIIEVHVHDDGTINRCKFEWFPFYDAVAEDF